MAEENQHAGALSKLALRIRQTSEKPPTLSFSVENKHDAPLTILRWNTPLDPLAIQVGLVSITPEGKSEPIEVHTVQLRRIMPPRPEDLVTLQPGESQEQEIVLKEPIVALDSLGKTARVAVKGKWQVVWPTTADKLSQATLEKLQFGEGVLTGEFESTLSRESFFANIKNNSTGEPGRPAECDDKANHIVLEGPVARRGVASSDKAANLTNRRPRDWKPAGPNVSVLSFKPPPTPPTANTKEPWIFSPHRCQQWDGRDPVPPRADHVSPS
ncbi:putative secreted protein [Colletotrichum scovillei]|uniref:Secreted protein n=1 Tax=Colletotrichum scovillei TaxID=1209932 RepID=A0A9P7UJV4_9PEZI|nr:putative secreted protein [Colletotrichum scovillei]KAG7078081.1 putative secreted protein [Colletotrichum scovillei]KAG7085112.1 putative secreted protein [Colletotrichum scovillei]